MPQKLRIPIFVFVLLDCFRLRGQPIPPQEPRTVADSGGHFADFVISSGQVTAFLRCGSAAAAQAHHTLDSLLASGPCEPIHVASGKRSVHWCSSTRSLAMDC